MPNRWGRGLGLSISWGAVVVWAVGLTVMQPMTEPHRQLADAYGGNNTYWARDARWTAVVIIAVGLILAARGNRLVTLLAGGGGAAWLGVDTWLDRLDITGVPATAACIGVGGAVVTAAWFLSGRRDLAAHRTILIMTAALAAVLASTAVGLTGPEDVDPPVIRVTAALLTVLLTALTLGCASSASPPGRPSPRIVLAFAIGAMLLLLLAFATMYAAPAGFFFVVTGLASLLLSAVIVLTARTHVPDGSPTSVAAACLAISFIQPVLFLLTLLISMMGWPSDFADALTRLAGNPSINTADEDLLMTLVAIPVGLVCGGYVLHVHRLRQLASDAERRQALGSGRRRGPADVWPG